MRFLMFDVSPDGANLWFDVSNLVLLVGAVLVAAGTYGTIKFSGIKEKFSDERISINETETRKAVAESDKANAALGIAQADIAKANAQIAEANARERVAELKLEEVRKQLRPRQLNDEAFLTPLREVPPKKFKILYVKDVSDALFLAMQISSALQTIGWTMTEQMSAIEERHSIFPEGISLGSAISVGGQATGVSAVVRKADMEKDRLAWALVHALQAAFGTGAVGRNEQQPEDLVTIVIAPRL